ncbi:hypothetical protein [Burkholderia sp. WAC0059]|uniref:hypothetical protein n=1 Tax=Burkholderia sp. WAC0059 TaxID=2066022 RepID=UPI0015E0D451|nr:hypothetical protein [Burkholderia sp. WAC0059]
MGIEAIWLVVAVGLALYIAADMAGLRVNRVGIRRPGWVIASLCTGPLAAAIYFVLRRRVRKTLISAVWRTVGDDTLPAPVRRERLQALRHHGLIGHSIYRVCERSIGPNGAHGRKGGDAR